MGAGKNVKRSIIVGAVVAVAAGVVALASGTAGASQPTEHANSYVQVVAPNGGPRSQH